MYQYVYIYIWRERERCRGSTRRGGGWDMVVLFTKADNRGSDTRCVQHPLHKTPLHTTPPWCLQPPSLQTKHDADNPLCIQDPDDAYQPPLHTTPPFARSIIIMVMIVFIIIIIITSSSSSSRSRSSSSSSSSSSRSSSSSSSDIPQTAYHCGGLADAVQIGLAAQRSAGDTNDASNRTSETFDFGRGFPLGLVQVAMCRCFDGIPLETRLLRTRLRPASGTLPRGALEAVWTCLSLVKYMFVVHHGICKIQVCVGKENHCFGKWYQ